LPRGGVFCDQLRACPAGSGPVQKFLWDTFHDSPRACKVFFQIEPEGFPIAYTDQIEPEGFPIAYTDQIEPEGLTGSRIYGIAPLRKQERTDKMAILIFLMGFLVAACGLAFILENF